jgi:hypothetical protein
MAGFTTKTASGRAPFIGDSAIDDVVSEKQVLKKAGEQAARQGGSRGLVVSKVKISVNAKTQLCSSQGDTRAMGLPNECCSAVSWNEREHDNVSLLEAAQSCYCTVFSSSVRVWESSCF